MFHLKFSYLCGVLAPIFYLKGKIFTSEKLRLIQGVKYVASKLSLWSFSMRMPISKEQGMYGCLAEEKSKNAQMMHRSSLHFFGSLQIDYHSRSWTDGQ